MIRVDEEEVVACVLLTAVCAAAADVEFTTVDVARLFGVSPDALRKRTTARITEMQRTGSTSASLLAPAPQPTSAVTASPPPFQYLGTLWFEGDDEDKRGMPPPQLYSNSSDLRSTRC